MKNRRLFTILLFAAAIIIPLVCILPDLNKASVTTRSFLSGKNQTDNESAAKNSENTLNNESNANNSTSQSQTLQKGDGQAVEKTVNKDKKFSEVLKEKGIKNPGKNMEILVDKSDQTLYLLYNGESLKSYHIEYGSGGIGDKEVYGDNKTPEGTFYVSNKSVLDPPDYYLGSRWLGVSYPNIEDADRGLKQGLISKNTHDSIVSAFKNMGVPSPDTKLGGSIGIHGGSITSFGSNWTWGCVGLANKDIEEFYSYIPVGTKIIIQK